MNKFKCKIRLYSLLPFFEFIKKRNLNISNIIMKDDYTYIFYCSYFTYKKIKKEYKNVQLLSNNSIGNVFLKIFSEKLVIICLIISSIFYIYLSNKIFDIEINGTSEQLNYYLEKQLETYNIKKSYSLPTIKELKKIEKDMYIQNNDKLDLLSIIKKGSYIIVNYELKKENLVLDNNKGKIYSKKDAIISKILIGSGNVLVKENQFIKKGNLLVDDSIIVDEKIHYVGTKGIIYGYVYNKIEISYQNYEIDKILLDARYLVSKNYILEEKILEENILHHDLERKILIIHYKCEEILNSY